MKKTFITLLLILFNGLGLSAQTTYEPKCTMTIEEIAMAQPYHRDHPKQEDTERIANTLITEINAIYILLNTNELTEVKAHKNTIKIAVNQAIAMGMNYAMFQEDIDFINSVKDKK